MKKINRFCVLILGFGCACSFLPGAKISTPTTSLPQPQVVIETVTPTSKPIFTATPQSPAVLIFPYTIEGLREHAYESGKINVIRTLVQNEQYTTYYIDYPSDGLKITGILQIPVGQGPFPVIVMNHGFFTRESYFSGDGTDRAAEFLVKRGFITVSSDYRSWGDSDIGDSFFYSGLAIDVINLLKAIPSIPQADPDRIGMWGHSMGGGTTMKVLAILGKRVATSRDIPEVKAAILYSTVSADQLDVIDRWGMGCFGDIAAGELLYGCNSSDIIPDTLSPELQNAYRLVAGDAELLKKVSPYYYLSDIAIPLQIHYGAKDGLVFSGTPPEWSRKLYKGFVEAGNADTQLFGYDDQLHSFKADAWFAFMERSSQFFEKYVKNAQ